MASSKDGRKMHEDALNRFAHQSCQLINEQDEWPCNVNQEQQFEEIAREKHNGTGSKAKLNSGVEID
jgi:hypothetical protein